MALNHCAIYRSLWEETGIAASSTPALQAPVKCDIVIVGGGITGLSTALHAAELGFSVCVLEAQEPAWGASGRNGGQVIPGIKHDPEVLLRRYGKERGQPLLEMVGSAADAVFDVIQRYDIKCDPVRAGWIQPAHSEKTLAVVQNRAREWMAHGASVDLLSREEVTHKLGTNHYLGGWIDRRAGSVQPMSYTRGLMNAAVIKGAQVYGHSEVAALEQREDSWVATTRDGIKVEAHHAVIATNGYTGNLWPSLRQSIITANSFVIATDPLEEAIGGQILKGKEVVSDSRRLLLYFRRDAQGRFIIGGRGRFQEPRTAADWSHLERSVGLLYPQLKNTPFPYKWAGRVAITRDAIPHVHQPARNLHIALGYNGRGVALATQMGRYLANTICKGESMPFPITDVKPIPLHGMRRLYVAMGIAYFGLCDRLS